MNNTEIRCIDCGNLLHSVDTTSQEEMRSCTKCGSLNRTIRICLGDNISLSEDTRLTLFNRKATGGKNVLLMQKHGSEFHFDSKTWQVRTRVIDKVKKTYYEKIINENTGDHIEKSEPLPDHKDHGSPKKKNK
jgi:hypothetical protein